MTPWNVVNEDEMLLSPGGESRVVFRDMNEIAMGGPLGGQCYVLEKGGTAVYLGGWCGCPAVWDAAGKRVALPFWMEGRSQRLAIADFEAMELRVSTASYRVLDLAGVDDSGAFMGVDSPLVRTEPLSVDAEKMDWLLKRPLSRVRWHCIDFSAPGSPWEGATEERAVLQELHRKNRIWHDPTPVWTMNPAYAPKVLQPLPLWVMLLFGIPLLLLFAVLALALAVVMALGSCWALVRGRPLTDPKGMRSHLEGRMLGFAGRIFNPLLGWLRRGRGKR